MSKITKNVNGGRKASNDQITLVDDLMTRTKELNVLPARGYVDLVVDTYKKGGYAEMDEKTLRKAITKCYTRESSPWEVAIAIHSTAVLLDYLNKIPD